MPDQTEALEEAVAYVVQQAAQAREERKLSEETYTGGSVDYYKVSVPNPVSGVDPYTAECSDIIEALGLDFFEGNIFKALWRSAMARKFGKSKKGYDNGKYDAEKIEWFAKRIAARFHSPVSQRQIETLS